MDVCVPSLANCEYARSFPRAALASGRIASGRIDRSFTSNTVRISAVLGLKFALAGCSIPTVQPSIDPALLLLNSVATDVSAITRQVSEIQQTNHPTYRQPIAQDARLMTKINVLDYVGPPAKLLQELARRIGYSYVELGSHTLAQSSRATPFDITVSVRSKRQTVLNIIRDIAAQVGTGIVISVSEVHQEIRLEYL